MSDTGRVIFAKASGVAVNEAGEKFLLVTGTYSTPIIVPNGTRESYEVLVPMDGITETELAIRTHEYVAEKGNEENISDAPQGFTAADVTGGRL